MYKVFSTFNFIRTNKISKEKVPTEEELAKYMRVNKRYIKYLKEIFWNSETKPYNISYENSFSLVDYLDLKLGF